MDPLVKDLFSIVLEYVPLFQFYDMEKIYPKGMKYFLGKLSIGEKIRGAQRLSCENSYTMDTTQEGVLCASGSNTDGELGLGDKKDGKVFKKIET
jgi:hypothetical protein